MSDTPEADQVARDIAENVYAAYAHRATSAIHPSHEQVLLTRLAEAIRPVIGGSSDGIVRAANTALDDWEMTNPDVRGPRVVRTRPADRSVSMEVG
ncbi:MAG: hypothetical protein EOO77_47180 [Oxalobacteraceae bacterium]|nr:MAG: hypothetical protein EOO77_47180 [Oxalobacteraceae bacterium]